MQKDVVGIWICTVLKQLRMVTAASFKRHCSWRCFFL